MSDYNFLIESRLSPEQLQIVNHLSRIAASQGLNLYLAGGAVRDLTYRQQAIHDLDFVVEGSAQKIVKLLTAPSPPRRRPGDPRSLVNEGPPPAVREIEFDQRQNSAEILFGQGTGAEIAMSRNEVYTRPGHRPEILPASIFEDLKRRDFSVNAMAVSLHPNSRGLLLDPTNGAADIEKRELRALHSRSFFEDPLRIYRLLRLGARLDFKPEERTEQWLQSAIAGRAWESLEAAAQGRELRAILREENCGRVLKILRERGLLGGLDRKLASAKIAYDRFERIRSVVRSIPGADPYLLNFHCLVQTLPGAQEARLAKIVLGQAKTIRLALNLERAARKLAQALGGSKAALPSHVYTLLSGTQPALLLFLLVHYPQPKVQNRVKSFLLKFPAIRAALPRAELQAMGMEPGPKFERVIERVFLDQLDGKIKTSQQVTKALREYSGIKPPPPLKPAVAAAARARKKRPEAPAKAPAPTIAAPEARRRKPERRAKVSVRKAPALARKKAPSPATETKRAGPKRRQRGRTK